MTNDDPAPSRLDLAQLSYNEVLDATKHQDDKIGRFLGAIAFLVAGALVFAADATVTGARFRVGHETLLLPAIALGLFLTLITLSAMIFILASATPLTLPRGASKVSDQHSRLFFMSIARETQEEWTSQWNLSNADLAYGIAQDFISESYNLGGRATRKYERSGQAATLFMVSLVFFVTSMVLSIEALGAAPTSAHLVIAWSLRLRIETSVLLGLFALILVQERQRSITQASAKKRSFLGRTVAFWLHVTRIAYPAAVVLAVLPNGGRFAWLIGLAMLAASLIAGLSLSSGQSQTGSKASGRPKPTPTALITVGVSAALGVVGIWAITLGADDWQLLVATLGTILPLTSNFRRHTNPHAGATGTRPPQKSPGG